MDTTMTIVKFQVSTENISGLKLLDMADYMSSPVTDKDLIGIQCVKADGLYFKLPEEHEGTLAELLTDEAIITEFEALGLRRMVKKYLTDHCKISVA